MEGRKDGGGLHENSAFSLNISQPIFKRLAPSTSRNCLVMEIDIGFCVDYCSLLLMFVCLAHVSNL